jgi:hypothetical protein
MDNFMFVIFLSSSRELRRFCFRQFVVFFFPCSSDVIEPTIIGQSKKKMCPTNSSCKKKERTEKKKKNIHSKWFRTHEVGLLWAINSKTLPTKLHALIFFFFLKIFIYSAKQPFFH